MGTTQTIKLVLADDHTLFREGLALILKREPDIELVAQAKNGEELVTAVRQHQPHVVITDLRMPVKDGVNAVREIYSEKTNTQCIVTSAYGNEYSIVDALEAGAIGYISKAAESDEFPQAIRLVRQGIPYYCKTTSASMLQILARSKYDPHYNRNKELFSPLEIKIILCICKEMSSKEIGERLSIGKRNVDLFRGRILGKTKSKTTAGIVIYALRHNLISLDDLE